MHLCTGYFDILALELRIVDNSRIRACFLLEWRSNHDCCHIISVRRVARSSQLDELRTSLSFYLPGTHFAEVRSSVQLYQLGDGSTLDSTTPVEVASLPNSDTIESLAASGDGSSSLAVVCYDVVGERALHIVDARILDTGYR